MIYDNDTDKGKDEDKSKVKGKGRSIGKKVKSKIITRSRIRK